MSIERIIAGVDGSDDSRRAPTWAAALAAQLDAELVAVHAVGLLEHGEDLSDVLEAWCEPMSTVPGLRHRALLENGPPAMVLMRVAESDRADLIVVGTLGAGGFDELLLGSTTGHLVQHSPVPVTVIRRQGR